MTPTFYRLFVAVPVPEEVRREMLRAQSELKAALASNSVRWTRPEQFHLTLRFLGGVDASSVQPLAESLRSACAGFAPLALRSERIGFFPHARSPRVIWAWVHDELEALPRVQKAVEGAVQDFTAEKSESRFTGHVTLGRCPGIGRREADRLGELAKAMETRVFGEWRADKIELIRSELAAGGARYSVLAGIPLAAPESSGTLPPP